MENVKDKPIVFDLDGTIFNIEHRRHYVINKPKNWKAFNNSMHLDTVYEEIVFIARTFWRNGHDIILCSGRNEAQRKVTTENLFRFDVPFNALYMREDGDNRSDDIVKSEMLDELISWGLTPYIWFDDRDQVVNMLRNRGIRCLQVAPGNF